jgi:hypothetical protein
MRGIKYVSAGFAAAIALGLSSPQTGAQGLLTIEPHPLDSTMSPYPLGPLQKFGEFSPGYVPQFSNTPQAAAPQTRQAQAAPAGQPQMPRRQSARAEPRQTALRASARRQEARRATTGGGTVLSLAPRYGERPASTPFCFPSSTLHIQQDARCNLAAPVSRGRFEELLGE